MNLKRIFWQTIAWGSLVFASLFCFYIGPVVVCDMCGAPYAWGWVVLGLDLVVTAAVWRTLFYHFGVLP